MQKPRQWRGLDPLILLLKFDQRCSKLVSDVRNRTPVVYRWGEGLLGKVFAGVVALAPLEAFEVACAS